MSVPRPRVLSGGRRAPRSAWRPLALSLVLALGAFEAWLTLGPLPSLGVARPAAEDQGPLAGTWRSIANGDRINRLELQGSRLWAATEGGGLVAWNLTDGSYTQYLAPQDGLASNVVYDVAPLADGTVWAGTAAGLAVKRAGQERFVNLTASQLPGMPSRVVTAIEPLPDGRLWLGFAQEWDAAAVDPKTGLPGTFRPGGVALFDPARGTWTHEAHATLIEHFGATGEQYETIPSENVTDIAVGTDGLVWVGTRQYYRWDPNEFRKVDPNAPPGFWVLAGGGLAAFDGLRWKNWLPAESGTGCYSYHITDLVADVQGRIWAGTAGKGLLVMREGLQTSGCSRGVALYLKARRDIAPGLQSNQIWSVAIDEAGRVWAASDIGSIDILEHHNTFDDSSISARPWMTDDVWSTLWLDDDPKLNRVAITALLVRGRGYYFGTKEQGTGDGDGIRSYDPVGQQWRTLRTAAHGLPSNQITGIAGDPVSGAVWFAFRHAGVARFDGREWRSWRAFGAGRMVTTVKQEVAQSMQGTSRIAVNLASKADFDAAFPATARYARIGDDPTLYRVIRYTAERAGNGPFIDVKPSVFRRLSPGTPIYAVDRGPASNAATRIAVDRLGRVWVGGRETMWLGSECPADRARLGECWQDGGLGRWDGTGWDVYWQHALGPGANTIPDQDVRAVAVGLDGRVWVGTADDGVAVLNPGTGQWVGYNRANVGSQLGSDGVFDISIDPSTGEVWLAHRLVEECLPAGDGSTCVPTLLGGGISRFDGERWQSWSKSNSTLRAFGNGGEFSSLLIDPGRGLVWAGGYDGDPRTLHWNSGVGVHAVLNWCRLPCQADDWKNIVWSEDGEVAALTIDSSGNLWAGLHRSGTGITPPVAGLRLYDTAGRWHTYTPANSGLPSNEITALATIGEEVWIGTLHNGVSVYRPAAAEPSPTATVVGTLPVVKETPTTTASPTNTAASSPTVAATPTAVRPARAGRQSYLPLALRPR